MLRQLQPHRFWPSNPSHVAAPSLRAGCRATPSTGPGCWVAPGSGMAPSGIAQWCCWKKRKMDRQTPLGRGPARMGPGGLCGAGSSAAGEPGPAPPGREGRTGPGRAAPSYLFKGWKPESFSWALFIFKCESHRGVFSFVGWFNTVSIFRTSQLFGYARPEGSCQGPHREPLLQLVTLSPTKNQTALNHDTERNTVGGEKIFWKCFKSWHKLNPHHKMNSTFCF